MTGIRLRNATTGAESPERLRALIDELAPGSLAVNLDPGALLVNDESPREAVSQLGPWVQHVRASDGVRDFAKRQGIETQLGRGAADYPELIAMLEEHRYSGYYTIQRLHATEGDASLEVEVLSGPLGDDPGVGRARAATVKLGGR